MSQEEPKLQIEYNYQQNNKMENKDINKTSQDDIDVFLKNYCKKKSDYLDMKNYYSYLKDTYKKSNILVYDKTIEELQYKFKIEFQNITKISKMKKYLWLVRFYTIYILQDEDKYDFYEINSKVDDDYINYKNNQFRKKEKEKEINEEIDPNDTDSTTDSNYSDSDIIYDNEDFLYKENIKNEKNKE